ncbi:ABC transporter ATP-binding protein [Patescibacteria group bacterium]|nr:ABC transporter ATP-binding protein [Patescibacteria group bacterium]MCG2702213.1 ABC transporter ATP-binding protein [Candidatus Parcubacteria bacterium]MBU4264773.1 ABC transporter ATP-binding protein [Patescibacteria group bacterium]MBU4390111.1 ABC transporter ATP-binding protein [Patescibacteria group bacterium]MBU4431198.1 ABC transporter ATP-binding protein [Patescibacteria group bacterium]
MKKNKNNPIIKFEQITKTYITGPVKYQALKGIDIKINKGEFVAIIGHSGSGKSTIMNLMGALDSPTSGKYFLNGKNISHYNPDELAEIRNKQIGFIFQSYNLLPRTTVLKNVERPMLYAGYPEEKRKKRAMEVLKIVGLADKASNLSNHISGGQIQRVAIARALTMNPSIILADEPTGNLDTKTAHEVMKFLVQLNKKGSTVVVITHEDDIAAFAKRIIKITDGLVESRDYKLKTASFITHD